MKRVILLLIVLFGGYFPAIAQNAEVSTYIQQLYVIWDSTYLNYSVSHDGGDSIDAVNLLKKVPVQMLDNTSSLTAELLEQEVLLQEAKTIDGDIGLSMRADYSYNLDPGIGFEDNLFYDQRFRVGLEMDLLSSGLFANNTAAQIKYNELEIKKLQSPEQAKKQERYLKWHNIIYQFNLKKIEILRSRELLAQQRVQMTTKLNFLKYVSQQDLISTISSQAEIQSMLNIYESYNYQLASELKVNSQLATEFPPIDINYAYSYKLLSSEEPDSISSLMIENIELADKTINDFKLKPFVAFNFYDLVADNPSYRNYFSVGLTLGAPLNFNSKNRANLRDSKSQLALVPASSRPEIQQDILTQFYEFRYKLKQYSNLYYKRKTYTELLRQEQVKHAISTLTFNPIRALELMDKLMQIDIEMVDTKQQMYLKALNIYTDLPFSQAEKLIHPINLKQDDGNSDHFNSIYVWSNTIEKNDPAVLAHYINLNPFQRATISFNSNPEAQIRANKLIHNLNQEGIDVELMIGKNALINGGFNEYMKGLDSKFDITKISAISLDVEPHTRDDWHENKAKYMRMYHELLAEARTYCDNNGLQLSVSIPTHYPEEDIFKIFDTVDRVYFMCYENVKTEFIVRKTNKYPLEKRYIALRTNDFKNRLEMEDKFKELNQSTKVAGYLVHDLGSLLDFDQNSLNKK